MTITGYWVTRCLCILSLFAPAWDVLSQSAMLQDLSWAQQPLAPRPGDIERGRSLVVSRQTGLCILCHSGPFPDEPFQGQLAPDLRLSAQGKTATQLRARLMDSSRFNPDTIMPSYYRTDHLNRVAPQFQGKTILTGQEIEDIVAYLLSLNP